MSRKPFCLKPFIDQHPPKWFKLKGFHSIIKFLDLTWMCFYPYIYNVAIFSRNPGCRYEQLAIISILFPSLPSFFERISTSSATFCGHPSFLLLTLSSKWLNIYIEHIIDHHFEMQGAAIDRILGEIAHRKRITTPIDYVLCIGHFLSKVSQFKRILKNVFRHHFSRKMGTSKASVVDSGWGHLYIFWTRASYAVWERK